LAQWLDQAEEEEASTCSLDFTSDVNLTKCLSIKEEDTPVQGRMELEPGDPGKIFLYKYPCNYVYFQKKIKKYACFAPVKEKFNFCSHPPQLKSGPAPASVVPRKRYQI
jgi:hypothetical protein